MKLSITKNYLLTPLLATCLISGCSLLPIQKAMTPYPEKTAQESTPPDSTQIKEALYRMYMEWQNVRFMDGGLSKDGIDCSGFVYITYLHSFGVMIPRNTKELSKTGEKVARYDMRSGDIVFFKTGLFKRHVGIFVEDGLFLHASKTKGVILSNMNNPYWSKRYRQARRILS